MRNARLHNELRAKMMIKGITQENLSKEMNLSATALNRKLNGRTGFLIEEAERIGRILDIEQDDLGRYFFNQ